MALEGGGAGVTHYNVPHITRLGQDILKVLRTYVKNRDLLFPVPGKELAEGDRSEHDARAAIAAIKNFELTVTRAVRTARGAYYTRQRRDGVHVGSLHVTLLTSSKNSELVEALVLATTEPFQMERGTYTIGLEDDSDAEALWIDISGPHDIVRYLADDLDLRWG